MTSPRRRPPNRATASCRRGHAGPGGRGARAGGDRRGGQRPGRVGDGRRRPRGQGRAHRCRRRSTRPSCSGAAVGQAPDAFVSLHDAFVVDPVVVDVPAGVTLPGAVVVVHVTTGDGAAAFPHLVVRAGDDSEVVGARGPDLVRRPGARRPGHRDPGRAGRTGRSRHRPATGHGGLADRPADVAGRGRGHVAHHQRRVRRRLRPAAHRLPHGRAGRHRRARRGVLRRGRPDARLPHLPGARRPRLHVEPAVQGRGRRPVPVGVHRA